MNQRTDSRPRRHMTHLDPCPGWCEGHSTPGEHVASRRFEQPRSYGADRGTRVTVLIYRPFGSDEDGLPSSARVSVEWEGPGANESDWVELEEEDLRVLLRRGWHLPDAPQRWLLDALRMPDRERPQLRAV